MDDAIARSYGMISHPSLRFGHDDLMLDDDTVDRLLDGLAADDAPPGYAWVARAFATLRAPDGIDPGAEEFAVALFRAARDEVEVLDEPGPVVVDEELPSDVRAASEGGVAAVGRWRLTLAGARARRLSATAGARARRLSATAGARARRLSAAAGAVAALSLATATSAAAMTGALPAPAQRAAHAVMSVVGVHVPGPAPRPVLSGMPAASFTHGPTSPVPAPQHAATAPVADAGAPRPGRPHHPATVAPVTPPAASVVSRSHGAGQGNEGAGNAQAGVPTVPSSATQSHGHGAQGQGSQGDPDGQGQGHHHGAR